MMELLKLELLDLVEIFCLGDTPEWFSWLVNVANVSMIHNEPSL